MRPNGIRRDRRCPLTCRLRLPALRCTARQALEAEALRVVGWYHSHPVFDNQPSLRDIANQLAYQNMFEAAGGAPFLGAIVGPFHPSLPGCASDLRWFHAAPDAEKAGGAVPLQFMPELAAGCALHASVLPQAAMLGQSFSPGEGTLCAHWRDGLTVREKLAASLAARLPAALAGKAGELYIAALLKRAFGDGGENNSGGGSSC